MNSTDEEILEVIDKARDTFQNIIDWLNGTREDRVSFADIEREVREAHSQLLENRALWLERKREERDRPLSVTLALLVRENGLSAFVRALADCCENPTEMLSSQQQSAQLQQNSHPDASADAEVSSYHLEVIGDTTESRSSQIANRVVQSEIVP